MLSVMMLNVVAPTLKSTFQHNDSQRYYTLYVAMLSVVKLKGAPLG